MTLLAKIKKFLTRNSNKKVKSSKKGKSTPTKAINYEDYELEERRQIYNPHREI